MFGNKESKRRFWQNFVCVQVILATLLAACGPRGENQQGDDTDVEKVRAILAFTFDDTSNATSIYVAAVSVGPRTSTPIQTEWLLDGNVVGDGDLMPGKHLKMPHPAGILGSFVCESELIDIDEAQHSSLWSQIKDDFVDGIKQENIIYQAQCEKTSIFDIGL